MVEVDSGIRARNRMTRRDLSLMVCPRCQAGLTDPSVCQSCGLVLTSDFVAYKRADLGHGVGRYGFFYKFWAAAWALGGGGFIALFLWSVSASSSQVDILWTLVLGSAAVLQIIEWVLLMRKPRLSRALTFVHAFVILGLTSYLTIMIASSVDVSSAASSFWPVFVIILVELVSSAGLIFAIGRSWFVDRELRRNLPAAPAIED